MLRKKNVKAYILQINGSNGILKHTVSYYFFGYQHYKVGNPKEGGRDYIPETRDTLSLQWHFSVNYKYRF